MKVVLYTQEQADQLAGSNVQPISLKDGRLITSKAVCELGVVNGLDLSTLPIISITDNDFVQTTTR